MKIRKIVLFTLGALVVVGAGVGVGVGIKSSNMNFEPQIYSPEWIKKLSPKDWEIQREIVRKKYCTARNTVEGGRLQQLLWRFDSVKREMEPPIKGPIYPRSREHGWNLYKPE